jgi:hypothetical protein
LGDLDIDFRGELDIDFLGDLDIDFLGEESALWQSTLDFTAERRLG